MISFFLGGARSGKSRRALDAAGRGLFVATAESLDVEFEQRIQRHQDERGEEWQTLSARLICRNCWQSSMRQNKHF